MTPKQILSSKLTIILLVILLGFLANVKYQQWHSQKAIEREKQNLSRQASSLEKNNNELGRSLSYLNTTGFKERVARQQLDLKKEGEMVFDFSEAPNVSNADAASDAKTDKSNFRKWWDYLMDNN